MACKKKLAREFGLPHFLLFPKSYELFGSPVWIGYLCALSYEKTILDLLHSLGVEDDMIMFDDLWQLPQIKPPSVVGVQGLRYWIA